MPDPRLRMRLEADASQAETELSGLKGSMTELNSAVQLIRTGMDLITGAVESLFQPIFDYAQQVRQLSGFTGDSAENTSRLVSVAGNFGVTAGTLETALRTMALNGLTPSWENMLKLADEFARLPQDERPAWLIKNFGRAGADMGVFLAPGAATLDAMADSLEKTNLVLSAADLDKMAELSMALNNWKEAVLSAKLALVDTGILQVLTDLVYGFAGALAALSDILAGGNIAEAIRGVFEAGLTRAVFPRPTKPPPELEQAGGPVGIGGSYIVGEHGAERFTPGLAGTISPNNDQLTQEIRRMLRTLPVILRDAVEKAK